MNCELSTHVSNLDQLRAWDYSAYDALYLGDYSCPRYKDNFSSNPHALEAGLDIAKSAGKKCYLSLYAVPDNTDLRWMEQLIETAMQLPFDAFEVHSLGLLHFLQEMNSAVPVHLGVFANLYTHTTANMLKQYNVQRIYPNPELGLSEIIYIRDHAPIEVLIPVHGKVPLVISETCFILENMSKGPESCRLECQSDHWLTRNDGEWLLKDIGRLTMSGKDLCMIREVERLRDEELDVFYIQSMRESREYVSKVGAIYRQALTMMPGNPSNRDLLQKLELELGELSGNGFCNGYYFGTAGQKYVRSAEQ